MEDINVDMLIDRIRNGAEWSEFTQDEVNAVIEVWKDQEYQRGYATGQNDFRASTEKELLEAYKERVVESTAAFNDLVTEPLQLVQEVIIYESEERP